MRLELENGTPLRLEAWAILTQQEAFNLMRSLEEFFAVDAHEEDWHYHVDWEVPCQLTVGIEDLHPASCTSDEDRRLDAEAWQRSTRAAEKLTTAEAHLDALVHGEDWQLRWTVADRLRIRNADDPRTVPALLDALQHEPEPRAREGIAGALGGFPGDERVVQGLRHALAFDDSGIVRWAAADALIHLGIAYP